MDTITNIRISAYCAASVAFDQKQNIYDGLKPLVKTAIVELAKEGERHKYMFNELRNKINSLFPVNINSAMLNKLLSSLKKDGTISDYKVRDSVVVDNIDDLSNEVVNNDYELQNFFEGFCSYLRQKGRQPEIEKIQEEICNLIFSRSTDLAEFMNKTANREDVIQETDSETIIDFLDYLLLCEREHTRDSLLYKRLYNGAVQASLLGFTPTTVDDVAKMNIATVILDTNFIVRLLGLQTPIENDMAKELWTALDNLGTEFIVLQSSIDEVKKSIKKFVTAYEPYQSGTRILRNRNIRSCGYLSAIQCGSTSLSHLQELTTTSVVAESLRENWKCSFFDDDYIQNSEEVNALIAAIDRDGYGKDSAKHDLSLIKHCIALRKEKQTFRSSAGKSGIWVLTEDNKLCRYSHQNADEVQECISETQLSNLLWLTKRKDCNNGLYCVVVALATTGMVTLEKYNSFVSKIHELASRKSKSSTMDCISLVVASDMFTTQDITDVAEGSCDIDSLIFQKSEELQHQNNVQREIIEKRIAQSEQDLSAEKIEKGKVQGENVALKKQLDENRSQTEELKKQQQSSLYKHQHEQLCRNLEDITRLEQRLDAIDKKYGRYAFVIIFLCYVVVGACIPLALWRCGVLGWLSRIDAGQKSRIKELLLSNLPGIIQVLWPIFAVLVPGIYTAIKGRGFPFSPQTMWRLVKNDLSFKEVTDELSGYGWLKKVLGGKEKIKAEYYVEDGGIKNIRATLATLQGDINEKEKELEPSFV